MAFLFQKYLQTGLVLVSSNLHEGRAHMFIWWYTYYECSPIKNYFQTILNSISITANIEWWRYWLYWYAVKLFSLWRVFAKKESLQAPSMVDIQNPNRKVVFDMCFLCTFKEVIMLSHNILAMKTDISYIAEKNFSRSALHL